MMAVGEDIIGGIFRDSYLRLLKKGANRILVYPESMEEISTKIWNRFFFQEISQILRE